MIRESFIFPFLLFPFPSRFLFFPKTFQSSILLTLQLVDMNNPNIEMTPSTAQHRSHSKGEGPGVRTLPH